MRPVRSGAGGAGAGPNRRAAVDLGSLLLVGGIAGARSGPAEGRVEGLAGDRRSVREGRASLLRGGCAGQFADQRRRTAAREVGRRAARLVLEVELGALAGKVLA